MNENEELMEETELPDTDDADESEEAEEIAEAEEAEESDERFEQLQEQYIRLLAEYKNYQNRTQKEKLEAYGNAVSRCAEQLLPVIDNFERAISASCTDETFKSGMEMIFAQFKGYLEKLGITELEALGAEFDPNVHQAIKQSEATEEFPENTVCEVFQKGYKLNDRLIRPAMVAVAN